MRNQKVKETNPNKKQLSRSGMEVQMLFGEDRMNSKMRKVITTRTTNAKEIVHCAFNGKL